MLNTNATPVAAAYVEMDLAMQIEFGLCDWEVTSADGTFSAATPEAAQALADEYAAWAVLQ